MVTVTEVKCSYSIDSRVLYYLWLWFELCKSNDQWKVGSFCFFTVVVTELSIQS